MSETKRLRVYLEAPMLETARAGTFNFLNQVEAAVTESGWDLEWHETGALARAEAPAKDGYALFHAEAPTHDRALSFRRAYFYPFWQIEPHQQRWRFHVADQHFNAAHINRKTAAGFVDKLRDRVMPGKTAKNGDFVLIPLQGRIRVTRSFQTMSPIEMVEAVAATGRNAVATFHPGEDYSTRDREALAEIADRHPNLTIGGQTAALLPECAYVATQNSAVAFEGLLFDKPAVLFAQSDFHHIALNVAELGVAKALALAPRHKVDAVRYLFWFLRQEAVNATAPDATAQIRNAMKRGGWPI